MPSCRSCGSQSVYHRNTKQLEWRCRSCGNEFTSSPPPPPPRPSPPPAPLPPETWFHQFSKGDHVRLDGYEGVIKRLWVWAYYPIFERWFKENEKTQRLPLIEVRPMERPYIEGRNYDLANVNIVIKFAQQAQGEPKGDFEFKLRNLYGNLEKIEKPRAKGITGLFRS